MSPDFLRLVAPIYMVYGISLDKLEEYTYGELTELSSIASEMVRLLAVKSPFAAAKQQQNNDPNPDRAGFRRLSASNYTVVNNG